jgi:alpha 1,3-mannosyltransferase
MGLLAPRSCRGLLPAFVAVIVLCCYLCLRPRPKSGFWFLDYDIGSRNPIDVNDVHLLKELSQYMVDYPILAPSIHPIGHPIGELLIRSRVLKSWLAEAENSDDAATKAMFLSAVEPAALSLFPFLGASPGQQRALHNPIAHLRGSFEPGSAGIVIPTSNKTLRSAVALIGALRTVLGSTLPIQVVYTGDQDLAPDQRTHLSRVVTSGPPLNFLDISAIFNNSDLRLDADEWPIKPFAALSSLFERVILVDADALFLQPPEVLLQNEAFLRTGALLSENLLLWHHAYTHEWIQWAWTEGPAAIYAGGRDGGVAVIEDSGLVVLDKSRPDILMGILCVCWQNTPAVREGFKYEFGYGDKENWWRGLGLYGSSKIAATASKYGGVIGWEAADKRHGTKVCGHAIAQVDDKDQLLWLKGSLLNSEGDMVYNSDKLLKWMIDGRWISSGTKQDVNCMAYGQISSLTYSQRGILKGALDLASGNTQFQ